MLLVCKVITTMIEFYAFLVIFIPLSWCLKLVEVNVPEVIDIRDKATLVCKFELGSTNLFSVKWYKDELEFFRYTPSLQPPIQTFYVEGIHLSESKNMTVITLHPLSYRTTGMYRCEVSTEGPLFKIDYKNANMTVLGIPKENPQVEGVKATYSIGDYVVANCTSSPSKPAAVIEWLINGHRAEGWLLEEYRTNHTTDRYFLESKKIGLKFQLDNGHFLGREGVLSLTCRAIVDSIVRRYDTTSHLAKLTNQKFAQEQLKNIGSSTTTLTNIKHILLCLLSLFIKIL